MTVGRWQLIGIAGCEMRVRIEGRDVFIFQHIQYKGVTGRKGRMKLTIGIKPPTSRTTSRSTSPGPCGARWRDTRRFLRFTTRSVRANANRVL